MKFYTFWAQGEATVRDQPRPWKLRAYGGSNEGLDEALRRANEIAASAAAAVEQGRSGGPYGYARQAVREEIIKEINDANGLSAVITRNSYGALILNTSRVMFVDVDYPSPAGIGETVRSLWNRLRGKHTATQTGRDERLLSRFNEVVASRPGLGLRIYRTAGGYRLLVTSDTYDPLSSDSNELLTAFGSDPLYIRLCEAQECFRARLSAKHWRCGATRPPSRFPWATPDEENRFRQWEEDYHQKANPYATCELVGTFGKPGVAEAVRPILETHDRLTIQNGAALA